MLDVIRGNLVRFFGGLQDPHSLNMLGRILLEKKLVKIERSFTRIVITLPLNSLKGDIAIHTQLFTRDNTPLSLLIFFSSKRKNHQNRLG